LKARVKAIEKKLDALPATNGKGKEKGKGANKEDKERKKLMKMHDDALDELAELVLDGDEGFGEEDGVDDFDVLMGGLEDGDGAGGAGSSGDGPDEDGGDEDEDDDDEPILGPKHDEDDSDGKGDHSEPPSFSAIPPSLLHAHLNLPTTAIPPPDVSVSSIFPNLQKARQPYVVELSAGDMLYLPASWWHEVTSSSSSSPSEEEGRKDDGVHMAFNYWFYPPTTSDFDEPYEDTLVWEYFRQKQADTKHEQTQADDDDDGVHKRAKRKLDLDQHSSEHGGTRKEKKARK